VAIKDVVVVASGGSQAPQAAGQQDSHAHRHRNGKGVSIECKPLNQAIHRLSPKAAYSSEFAAECAMRHTCSGAFSAGISAHKPLHRLFFTFLP